MAWTLLFLVLIVMAVGRSDSEKVTDKSDAMVKSIANQNQKVEEESEKLVKAIDKTSKQVESKEEEKKFQKASNKVDQLMKDSDDAVELKGKEAEENQFKAEQAVEHEGKRVDSIGKKISQTKNNNVASKAGKKSASRLEAIPIRRTSVSYTVKLQQGHYPHDSSSVNQNVWNAKDYGEKGNKHDISLEPFSFNIPTLDDEAISASHYIQMLGLKPRKKKHHHASVSLAAVLKHKHGSAPPLYQHWVSKLRDKDREDDSSNDDDDDNDDYMKSNNGDDDDNHDDNGDDADADADDEEEDDEEEDLDPEEDSSNLKQNRRPISLTGNVKIPLPENVKNEIKDERLLKAAHRRGHHRMKDFHYPSHDEERKSVKEMEQKWSRINALGSPELMNRWPFLGKHLGVLKGQQISVVSPQQVELMQTEFPDYPRQKEIQTTEKWRK